MRIRTPALITGGGLEETKIKFDSYGVGVRAGVITPQQADEESFREILGLPDISQPVEGAWQEDDGYRRPITLSHGQEDARPEISEGREDDDE